MPNDAKLPSPEYLAFATAFAEGEPEVTEGSMFGMRCLKRQGKAFAGGYGGGLVVKLDGPDLDDARAVPGAAPFDPSGRGKPMKAWVVLPLASRDRWDAFADRACASSVPG